VVALPDNQAPAIDRADKTYPYEEQFLLTLCLLEGHHRIQAAAEMGSPARTLSLLARESSFVSRSDDNATVLSG
jgi:hypothetical protein